MEQRDAPLHPLVRGDEAVPCDEDGAPLDPPYYLVKDIVRMKLLGVKERRVQEMIEMQGLPARKATREEELVLLRTNRVRTITARGVWLVEPDAVQHAEQHRKPVGFPKGNKRPKRGKETGVREGRR